MQLPPVDATSHILHAPVGPKKVTLSWLYKRLEKYYTGVSSGLTNIYGVYEVASEAIQLPAHVHTGAKIIGYTGIIDLLFAGPRLSSNIKSFNEAKSFYSHANSMIMTASEVSNLVTQGTQTVELLKEFKVVNKESFSWTSDLENIFLPLQFILLGQSIEQLVDLFYLRRNFHRKFTKPEKLGTPELRLENVRRGCQHVVATADDLQSTLSLSKKCKLKERAEFLLKRLHEANANREVLVHEGEQFLTLLQRRVSTRCVLDVANTVISCASTVLSSLSLAIKPNRLTTVIYAISTVAGIALSMFDALLIDKNPFKPNPDTWQARLIHHIRHLIYATCAKIHQIVDRLLIHPVESLIARATTLPSIGPHLIYG